VSQHGSTTSLTDDVHHLHQQISRLQRELLVTLSTLEEREAWMDDGARDMAHWVSMQLGVSYWKASRWLAAGRALDELPATSGAFEAGDLSIDKVVELTRLATPSRERGLVRWAEGVSSGAIRRRADLENRIERCAVEDAEESRSVRGGTSTRVAASRWKLSFLHRQAPRLPRRSTASPVSFRRCPIKSRRVSWNNVAPTLWSSCAAVERWQPTRRTVRPS
jgi:hypothetical protein